MPTSRTSCRLFSVAIADSIRPPEFVQELRPA
jgi:hypothetical protein